MDAMYDKQNSKSTLSALMKERQENEHSTFQLLNLKRDSSWMTAFQPVYGGTPPLWRLARTTEAGTHEEAVVSIQGILARKDLPPFKDKINPNSAHIRHLRQSISITGLSVTEFQEQVNIIADVEALLSRAVGEDNMQPCTIVGDLDGHSVLQASNRYFTPRKDAPNASEIPLAPDVDPYGILAKAVGSTLMHTEENVVYYYERTTSSDGKNPRYANVNPVALCIGDIVELQVSFILVPLRDRKFRITMVLRSILILDRSFTQKCAAAKIANQNVHSVNTAHILKRRVGYFEEDLSRAGLKLSRLEVEEGIEDAHMEN